MCNPSMIRTEEHHPVAICKTLPHQSLQGAVNFYICVPDGPIIVYKPICQARMIDKKCIILYERLVSKSDHPSASPHVPWCSWFSHLLESFLLTPSFASYFHHYPSDATAQHPPRQILPSEVTHESKSMQSNSSLWSIISNLKSSPHYLRSFMHVRRKYKWYVEDQAARLFVSVNVYDLGITVTQLFKQKGNKQFSLPSLF